METDRSVPSNFMSDVEYSVITSDVIKSFDCTCKFLHIGYGTWSSSDVNV